MYKLVWVENDDPLKTQHEINDVLAFASITVDDVNDVLAEMEKDYELSEEEYDDISYFINNCDDFPNMTELRDIVEMVIGRS